MGAASDLRKRRLRFRRSKPAERSMTMVEHLDELRSRLIISVAVFAAVSVVAFILYDPIFDFLLRPLCSLPPEKLGPQGCRLTQVQVLEGFQVRLKLTALVGLSVSSPVWLYQLWAFIVPGLEKREKRYALPFMLTSVALFAAGATLAYLFLGTGLELLIDLGGDALVPFFRADSYINFIGLMLIAFGLTFELPLLLFFLGLVGVVTPQGLRRHRRAAIVGIVALAAVVTPSQDPYTLLAMSVPLYLLYEATILLLALVLRRRRKAESL
ncbi:MAG: twin-arginine translocase subunit TatC [Actinomycetota bacterium]|nr:twin-arginine translocase subunit TatC [Actinomycetota bacterium]